jgi:1,4-alpha-glucan branching enzyme
MVRFRSSHKDLGLHRNGNEWVFLTGDFCDWSREAHPLRRSREIGVWEVRLPGAALKDEDLYKVHRVGANGAHDRMPSHASFLVQDEVSKAFSAQVVDQPDFQWQ